MDFGILSIHDEVDVAAGVTAKGTCHALEEDRGPFTHLVVEALPYRKHQPAERDVVGDLGMTDRAEQDGVVCRKPVEAAPGHHRALVEIPLTSPVVPDRV